MLEKDKLINLKLMVFFILSKSRVIFRNLKVNLSKIIGINRFDLIIAKSFKNVFALRVVESQRKCHGKLRDHA